MLSLNELSNNGNGSKIKIPNLFALILCGRLKLVTYLIRTYYLTNL